MSIRFGQLTVHKRPIIYAFCWLQLSPAASQIEPHDSWIVKDLVWKSIGFGCRHGENTLGNGRNGSLYNANEGCRYEAETDLNIKISGGIHICALGFWRRPGLGTVGGSYGKSVWAPRALRLHGPARGGYDSLCQRDRDHADGPKQKYVKRTLTKVSANVRA